MAAVNLQISSSITSPSIILTGDQLRNKIVEKVKFIAADYLTRISECSNEQSDRNVSLLNQGYFYGNEYFLALQKLQTIPRFAPQKEMIAQRIELLKKRNAFYYLFSNSKSFEPTSDGISLIGFRIKQNVKPSDALNDLARSLSFIGCGEACQIAYYQVLLEALGKEKFDIIFAASSNTPLTIRFIDPNPLLPLLIDKSFQEKKLKKGDIAFFVNIPEYSQKHLNGESAGFVTIVCSEDKEKTKKFTSLGLKPQGVSSEEMVEVFRSEYNRAPIKTAALSDELARQLLSQVSPDQLNSMTELENRTLSKEEFEKMSFYHNFHDHAYTLNFERIKVLAEAPIDSIRKIYDDWYEQSLNESFQRFISEKGKS